MPTILPQPNKAPAMTMRNQLAHFALALTTLLQSALLAQSAPAKPPEDALTNLLGWVDVRTFGAVADDGVDDTDAILLAFASLQGAPGSIYFPPGTFHVVAGKLVLPRNTELRGAGKWLSTIKSTAVDEALVRTEQGASAVSICDIGFDGSGVSNGPHFYWATEFRCERVRVANTARWGIWAQESDRGIIRACEVDNAVMSYPGTQSSGGTHAILLGNNCDEVIVVGCNVVDNHTAGILHYSSRGVAVGGNVLLNHAQNNTFAGIRVVSGGVSSSATAIFGNVTRDQPGGVVVPQDVMTGAQGWGIAIVANSLGGSHNNAVHSSTRGSVIVANVITDPDTVYGDEALLIGHYHPGQLEARHQVVCANVMSRNILLANNPIGIRGNNVRASICISNTIKMNMSSPSIFGGVAGVAAGSLVGKNTVESY